MLKKNEMFSWFGVLSNLKEIKVLSDYEIELIYNHPYKPALQELCMYQPLSMVSPKIMTEDNMVGMVGTGPYILESYKKIGNIFSIEIPIIGVNNLYMINLYLR